MEVERIEKRGSSAGDCVWWRRKAQQRLGYRCGFGCGGDREREREEGKREPGRVSVL